MGAPFPIFNQDYNALADTLSVIAANALRLLLVGCSAFLLAAALFLFLNFRRMRPIVRGMRRLGFGAKTVWIQRLQAMAVLIFASAALGAGLCCIVRCCNGSCAVRDSCAESSKASDLCWHTGNFAAFDRGCLGMAGCETNVDAAWQQR